MIAAGKVEDLKDYLDRGGNASETLPGQKGKQYPLLAEVCVAQVPSEAKVAMARMLIQHGASAKKLDTGVAFLHRATFGRDFDEALIGVLLEAGAEVMASDDAGVTPLHNLASLDTALTGTDPEAAIRTMGLLVEKGANVDARTRADDPVWPGMTPVVYAIANVNADPRFIQELLRLGADANALGAGGLTPLHYAARNLKPDLVEVLLRGGARPDIRDQQGETPLDAAVRQSPKSEDRVKAKEAVLEILRRRNGSSQ